MASRFLKYFAMLFAPSSPTSCMPNAPRNVPSFVVFEASMESSTFWSAFFHLVLPGGNVTEFEGYKYRQWFE